MRYCTKCGEQNPDEAKFCSKCGNQFMEETKSPSVNVASTQLPKYINVTMGILTALYVFMTIVWLTFAIESYKSYQGALRNANEYHPEEYYKHINPWNYVADTSARFDTTLCYTIVVFVTMLALGLLWHKKTKWAFYTYIIVAIISAIVAVAVALSSKWSSTFALGVLYPLGLMLIVIIFSFIKIKGQSLYGMLK